jgi:hypothetical protein
LALDFEDNHGRPQLGCQEDALVSFAPCDVALDTLPKSKKASFVEEFCHASGVHDVRAFHMKSWPWNKFRFHTLLEMSCHVIPNRLEILSHSLVMLLALGYISFYEEHVVVELMAVATGGYGMVAN